MVDVSTIRVSKADFQTLPKEERAVVLVSAHILNQIGVFLKLVQFSFSRDPTIPAERTPARCRRIFCYAF